MFSFFLQVGDEVFVDECTRKKCVVDDVSGETTLEIVVQSCNDEECNTGCVSFFLNQSFNHLYKM